jgi:tRNA-binding protein
VTVTEFAPAPVKPPVSPSVLESLDVRVGTIQAIEDVPGSRKLVKLTVGFGDHARTILAGLKQERPDLSVLVGRQALFVVNLEPRLMAGLVSEGMLFDIGYADHQLPALAVPERPVPDGVRAG